jgi:hypothetical protein
MVRSSMPRSRVALLVAASLSFGAGCATGQDPGAPAATAPHGDALAPAGPGTSAVDRAFDEQRQVYVVRAAFGLSAGIELRLISEPQRALTRIAVAVSGGGFGPELDECKALQIIVNASEVAAEDDAVTSATSDAGFQIESGFHFDHFKPLAQGGSTFAVRACEAAWQLSSEQVTELRKFLAFHTDLAAQVQRGELPVRSEPAAPGPDGS